MMVVLVGLPGSGKSTLCEHLKRLSQSLPVSLVRISQDELGTRKKCETMVQRTFLEHHKKESNERNSALVFVIDRTNATPEQRSTWLRFAKEFKFTSIAVVLDVDKRTCIERASKREGHPTVPKEKAAFVVNCTKMEAVHEDEGFDKILHGQPSEETAELVKKEVDELVGEWMAAQLSRATSLNEPDVKVASNTA